MSASSEASTSNAGRASLDHPATSNAAHTNGKASATTDKRNSSDNEEEPWQPIGSMSDAQVRTELQRVRDERDTFEAQYRSLLSKLTTMRATLGDRLRQDAEELDRRETQIDTLTTQLTSLESTTATLRDELVASHAETDRLGAELDALRKTVAANEGGGRMERERELHELVERVKLDAHRWEAACLEERARRQEAQTQLADAQHAAEHARQSEAHHRATAEREAASAANLAAVLSEFQSTQESELQRALGDHRTQLDELSSSLSEYKQRAESAESQLAHNATLASQAEHLAAQVKEKNLLIGKLRHEAVILNEHLTEALRRLRNDQSDANVDKRLVTNLLLAFLTTPRADGKRYEMLSLIAGVLGWRDEEREAAGLQRGSAKPAATQRRVSNGGAGAGDESFGNLFVEFLLSEAESGRAGEAVEGEQTAPSTPGVPSRLFSPTRSSFEPASPSRSDGRASGMGTPEAKAGGGLGSYFGLSRGSKK
ncbi:related to RUD3-suppressor of uso1-1 transport defect [Sporisorium reilianum SRZ2]|uniref:Related to RUD3-suppressor of uso1-1 transport defect n=1 Tax=Sporisorium reilianum (strain SRZ2) TaxID=999809 RepID=E7A2D3_SPORE|nr:related to RUD3-suppressor of uso1-1 transport defect [Sporisorium reilianum SRZ2]